MARLTTKAIFLCSFFSLCAFAETWRYDLGAGKQEVRFEGVGKPSMLKIHGTSEKGLKGTVICKGSTIEWDATFALDTLDTGIDTRNDHMKNKYLETKRYPTATLKDARVSFRAPFTPKGFKTGKGPFTGVLTLHGMTKPIKGQVSFETVGNELVIESDFEVPILDFGITRPGYAGISMTDNAHVEIKARAKSIR